MTYKLIQECGLEVKCAFPRLDSGRSAHGFDYYVEASALNEFLQKAVRVYGDEEIDLNKGNANRLHLYKGSAKFEGLMVNYREIPKLEPVTASELLSEIKRVHELVYSDNEIKSLIERAEKAGLK